MWNKKNGLFLAIFVLLTENTFGEESEIGLRYSYQQNQLSSSSFSTPESYRLEPSRLSLEDIYLHFQQGRWTFRGSGTAKQEVNGGYTFHKATVNEMFADFSVSSIEGSIGKKVLGWGVGYGFKPLDVIQRESRQALRTFELEGVPMLEIEYFTDESAITAVLCNRLKFDGLTPKKGNYEGALKYSTLLGDSDVHALVYQQGEGVSAGVGASTTFGDHLEWHGSFRYLSSYTALQHMLSGQTPTLLRAANVFYTQKHNNGVLALLGGSWAWENGVNLLLEAWHDSTAWTSEQWKELLRINSAQYQLLKAGFPKQAVYDNINSNNQVFSQQNLLKNNLFMRISYDGEKLDPEFSVLYTPLDGGLVYTVSADYDWSDQILIYTSARVMGGKVDSAYNNAANRWQIFLGLQFSGSFL